MLRSRIAALALIAALGGAGAAVQASAESVTPPAPMHRHDRTAWAKNRCMEHFARSAGHLAYLEAMLRLTAEQQPLWEKWDQAMTAGAEQQRAACLAAVPGKDVKPNILDRDARREQMLELKAERLKETRPALEALYHGLTPVQQAILDRPMRHGRHGRFGDHRQPEPRPL